MALVGRSLLLLACGFVTGLASPDLYAEEDLRRQLRDCLEVPSALRRLDCFDRLARASLDSHASSPPSEADRTPDATRSSPSTEERFGAESRRHGTESRDAAPPSDTIRSRLVRVEQRPRGEFVFHLESGEIWTEIEAGRGFYESGMEVTIRRTAFGGFMLNAEGSRATRVRRID